MKRLRQMAGLPDRIVATRRHVLQVEHDMRVVQGAIAAVSVLAAGLTWLHARRRRAEAK